MRKQNYYSEQRIYPALTLDDLRGDLIERCRRMAVLRRPDHPWRNLDDEELLRSANLWDVDATDRSSGYRMAAVLLLSRDETIGAVCPVYRTDALVRRRDVERYDDRLTVRTNLVDAYDMLSGFVRGQMPDRFHLDGDVSVSPRDIIVRELIANLLIHREYSSPMPGRIIVGNDGGAHGERVPLVLRGASEPGGLQPDVEEPDHRGLLHRDRSGRRAGQRPAQAVQVLARVLRAGPGASGRGRVPRVRAGQVRGRGRPRGAG